MKATSCYIPLLAAAYVSAHGFVWKLTVNGQAYTGNIPGGTESPSVIRLINTTFPNHGANNPNINCGSNATPGTLVASANPGDTLTFSWKAIGLINWPHNTGPMMTYLANCGSTTCDKYDPTNAKWFKIYQEGKQTNNDALWVQAEVMNGAVATVPLPKTLAPGNYMIRHEIIALHLATTEGGAEFYPSCAQIKVGGNQKGAPTPEELVTFPGGYKDTDKGIFDPDVYNPSATYVFPGPAIAAFVGGASSSSSSKVPTATATGSTPPIPSSKSSGQSCQITLPYPSDTPSTDVVVRPRHFSRIMRRLLALGERRRH